MDVYGVTNVVKSPTGYKSKTPTHIIYRSYKNFNEEHYLNDLSCMPLHVGQLFDDTYWFCEKLLSDTMNIHAPIKKRVIKNNQAA